jgi:hypothetical protein
MQRKPLILVVDDVPEFRERLLPKLVENLALPKWRGRVPLPFHFGLRFHF